MNAHTVQDEFFMRRAIELARNGWGTTHPNPLVGAVIVEKNSIVSEGWHEQAGKAHAEIAALNNLGRHPNDQATLYVTLEPCSTTGKTGACCHAILNSGIRKVVVGTVDPNPAHAGRGLDWLRANEVDVTLGVMEAECRELNLIFNHWIATGQPLVALKIATTLDGKFCAASGHSKWVTGDLARADVMRWRRYFPGICVSAATVLADDPSLTSRYKDEIWCPHRYVFDRKLRTSFQEKTAQLYSDNYVKKTTIVCDESANSEAKDYFRDLGISIWELPASEGELLPWVHFLKRLSEAGTYGLYIEGGPGFSTGLLETKVLDYLFVYQAPKLMADTGCRSIGTERSTQNMNEAIELSEVIHTSFGPDHLTRGFLK